MESPGEASSTPAQESLIAQLVEAADTRQIRIVEVSPALQHHTGGIQQLLHEGPANRIADLTRNGTGGKRPR